MRSHGARVGSVRALLGAAALLFAASTSAQPAPSPEASRAANAAFQEGVRHLDAARYAQAAEAFERSLALHETAAGAYDLGLARRALGDPVGAVAAFTLFLTRARPEHPARARAAAAIAALREQIGHVVVTVEGEAAELRVDDAPARLEAGVHERDLAPGAHAFEARWPGLAPVRMEVAIAEGETVNIPMRPPVLLPARDLAAVVLPRQPDPSPARPLYRNPWLWVGVGAGAAVAAAVVTAVVLSSSPPSYNGGTWNTLVQGAAAGP